MEKRQGITAWLRKRISHLDYGFKWCKGIVHCNRNDEVLDHLRKKTKVSHLTNEKLARHFSGEDTFYFAGNSWGDETMVMVDIDCAPDVTGLPWQQGQARETLLTMLLNRGRLVGHRT